MLEERLDKYIHNRYSYRVPIYTVERNFKNLTSWPLEVTVNLDELFSYKCSSLGETKLHFYISDSDPIFNYELDTKFEGKKNNPYF